MPEQSRHLVYELDGWEIDLARHELRRRGVPVPLGNRAFHVLAILVQSGGELVTKDELMARVWPGAIVEENTIEVHISAIRKALGTARGTVKTTFGRGYRLVGDWKVRKENASAPPLALDPTRMSPQPFLSNVPAAGSELISRTAAVQHLQEFLSAYRAITLTGPGGIGKTALALEVARSLASTFQGDRWLVDLVCQLDPALVASTVASVLGLKLGADEISPESIARCFSDALAVAREQDALSLEMRIALSLARLRVRQDRHDDAQQLLAPVYNRFTEGLKTPDLLAARAMLQSLSSRPA